MLKQLRSNIHAIVILIDGVSMLSMPGDDFYHQYRGIEDDHTRGAIHGLYEIREEARKFMATQIQSITRIGLSVIPI